jgi:hypothetical protein
MCIKKRTLIFFLNGEKESKKIFCQLLPFFYHHYLRQLTIFAELKLHLIVPDEDHRGCYVVYVNNVI